jgi:hypothetical protein
MVVLHSVAVYGLTKRKLCMTVSSISWFMIP